MEVAHIDDEGRAVRVKQWIIELEAPIDLTALLRPDEGNEALEYRAAEALSVLEGQDNPQPTRPIDKSDVFDARETHPKGQATSTRPGTPRHDVDEAHARSGIAPSAGAGTPASKTPAATDSGADLAAIATDALQLGVPGGRFEEYAEKRWGKGWKLNASGRKRAHEEVRSFTQDAQGFRAKVDAELNVFS
jgi:hypothetical protein